MTDDQIHSGMAALSICEVLLLALNDAGVLEEKEIIDILTDAAAAHEIAAAAGGDVINHKETAALIRQIITGGNSVRRP